MNTRPDALVHALSALLFVLLVQPLTQVKGQKQREIISRALDLGELS